MDPSFELEPIETEYDPTQSEQRSNLDGTNEIYIKGYTISLTDWESLEDNLSLSRKDIAISAWTELRQGQLISLLFQQDDSTPEKKPELHSATHELKYTTPFRLLGFMNTDNLQEIDTDENKILIFLEDQKQLYMYTALGTYNNKQGLWSVKNGAHITSENLTPGQINDSLISKWTNTTNQFLSNHL